MSACEFLYECDAAEKYSKVEMRRFRCYETTLVIAYARPFVQSRAEVAPLSLKMTGVKLSDEKLALHQRLIEMRNKRVAHSDSDMMRMTVQPFNVFEEEDAAPIYMLQTVFDEGITVLGPLLAEVNGLLGQVYDAIVKTLYREAQINPGAFNMRVDYLAKNTREPGDSP